MKETRGREREGGREGGRKEGREGGREGERERWSTCSEIDR